MDPGATAVGKLKITTLKNGLNRAEYGDFTGIRVYVDRTNTTMNGDLYLLAAVLIAYAP